jgi:F-type H+-transporting ATPase subunit b
MDLLTSLGVNSSLFIQFGLFLVVYVVLKHVLFEPYYAAYKERSERTVGKAELAERFVNETKALEEQFSARAQEANEKYMAVYEKTRSEAMKEYDIKVNDARARAKKVVDESRRHIESEVATARVQLNKDTGAVSQLINQKLIGKDLSP